MNFRLSRNIFEIIAVKGDHIVVFVDGTVGSLDGLIKVTSNISSEGGTHSSICRWHSGPAP